MPSKTGQQMHDRAIVQSPLRIAYLIRKSTQEIVVSYDALKIMVYQPSVPSPHLARGLVVAEVFQALLSSSDFQWVPILSKTQLRQLIQSSKLPTSTKDQGTIGDKENRAERRDKEGGSNIR